MVKPKTRVNFVTHLRTCPHAEPAKTTFHISFHIILHLKCNLEQTKIKQRFFSSFFRERSASVEDCLTRGREAAGSSLTGVTALWSVSKTHSS